MSKKSVNKTVEILANAIIMAKKDVMQTCMTEISALKDEIIKLNKRVQDLENKE